MTSLAAHTLSDRALSFIQSVSLEGTTHSACPGTTFGMAEASGGKPKDPGKEKESPKAPEPSTLSGDKEESSEGHFRDGKWYQKEDSGFQNPASAETRGKGTPEHVVKADDEEMDTTPAADLKHLSPLSILLQRRITGTLIQLLKRRGPGPGLAHLLKTFLRAQAQRRARERRLQRSIIPLTPRMLGKRYPPG